MTSFNDCKTLDDLETLFPPRKDLPEGAEIVRIAPSPTGMPHIGTAMQSVLDRAIADRSKGVFILRIEDTDQARTIPGAVEEIINGLKWLGNAPDEGVSFGGNYGPYIQTERLPIYRIAAQKLVDDGHAYPCFCTEDRLNLVVEGPGHLRIPRPELKHAFVLKPLADIAPDFVDPLGGRTLAELWRDHPQHDEAFEVVGFEEGGGTAAEVEFGEGEGAGRGVIVNFDQAVVESVGGRHDLEGGVGVDVAQLEVVHARPGVALRDGLRDGLARSVCADFECHPLRAGMLNTAYDCRRIVTAVECATIRPCTDYFAPLTAAGE